MPMYNLLEYSGNYYMTLKILCNNYRDEINNDPNENYVANNKMINNNKTVTIKIFEYETKIRGTPPNYDNTLDTEIVVLLKYLSNFWRLLNWLLINCEVELDSSW